MKKNLQTSEWILSASLVVLLASLALISRLHEHRKESELRESSLLPGQTYSIVISGEVSNPGTFVAKEGVRLGDIVKKSRPKRFADLCALNLDCPVESPMEISVALLKEITVRIEGAVPESMELTMPAGTRICDLKSKIQLTEDADLKFWKRRRLLKNGETLVVPRKGENNALDRKSTHEL